MGSALLLLGWGQGRWSYRGVDIEAEVGNDCCSLRTNNPSIKRNWSVLSAFWNASSVSVKTRVWERYLSNSNDARRLCRNGLPSALIPLLWLALTMCTCSG